MLQQLAHACDPTEYVITFETPSRRSDASRLYAPRMRYENDGRRSCENGSARGDQAGPGVGAPAREGAPRVRRTSRLICTVAPSRWLSPGANWSGDSCTMSYTREVSASRT